MTIQFCTAEFKWVSADQWTEDFLWSGIFIAFTEDLKAFDCAHDEALAMLCSSYRYGIAFEVYGISNGIAGVPLGYFPDESLVPGPGKYVDKTWLIKNWNTHFGFLLPKLQHVRFSAGKELEK